MKGKWLHGHINTGSWPNRFSRIPQKMEFTPRLPIHSPWRLQPPSPFALCSVTASTVLWWLFCFDVFLTEGKVRRDKVLLLFDSQSSSHSLAPSGAQSMLSEWMKRCWKSESSNHLDAETRTTTSSIHHEVSNLSYLWQLHTSAKICQLSLLLRIT